MTNVIPEEKVYVGAVLNGHVCESNRVQKKWGFSTGAKNQEEETPMEPD